MLPTHKKVRTLTSPMLHNKMKNTKMTTCISTYMHVHTQRRTCTHAHMHTCTHAHAQQHTHTYCKFAFSITKESSTHVPVIPHMLAIRLLLPCHTFMIVTKRSLIGKRFVSYYIFKLTGYFLVCSLNQSVLFSLNVNQSNIILAL